MASDYPKEVENKLPIELIDINPHQSYVSQEHVQKLANSISKNAIRQPDNPIVVRVNPHNNERFQCADGWHRILAVKSLGSSEIRAKILVLSDLEMAERFCNNLLTVERPLYEKVKVAIYVVDESGENYDYASGKIPGLTPEIMKSYNRISQVIYELEKRGLNNEIKYHLTESQVNAFLNNDMIIWFELTRWINDYYKANGVLPTSDQIREEAKKRMTNRLIQKHLTRQANQIITPKTEAEGQNSIEDSPPNSEPIPFDESLEDVHKEECINESQVDTSEIAVENEPPNRRNSTGHIITRIPNSTPNPQVEQNAEKIEEEKQRRMFEIDEQVGLLLKEYYQLNRAGGINSGIVIPKFTHLCPTCGSRIISKEMQKLAQNNLIAKLPRSVVDHLIGKGI